VANPTAIDGIFHQLQQIHAVHTTLSDIPWVQKESITLMVQ
jgi:hypothetical protein